MNYKLICIKINTSINLTLKKIKKKIHMKYKYNTIKNNKIEHIKLTKNNPIKGVYKDGFRIELIFTPTNNKEYITIKNRNPLIKENVYNDKGKVSKEQYIDIEPI